MKKQVIIGSTGFGLLICIQLYWFTNSFDANANQFDHKVSVALYAVADTMSENASVQKEFSNYFYVTANSSASSHSIDTMVQKEFSSRNIPMEYEIGVYNAEDDSLVYGKHVKNDVYESGDEIEIENDKINKNFSILFPSRRNYLVGQMDFGLLATFIFILISGIYFYVMATQHRSNGRVSGNRIRLGNSLLDYHNQNLIVNSVEYKLTYKENKILKLFFEKPNEVIEREVFLESVWKKDGFFVARSMDVFISRVRKYLSLDHNIKIENLRSIGYRLLVSNRKS